MSNKKYITSTLPYVGAPHAGHAFELVLGDAIARFYRMKLGRENVFFNTGLDQNGFKVWNKAQELKVDVKEYVDNNVLQWKMFFDLFAIDYNNFYQTSSREHHDKVQDFWIRSLERNNIYKDSYSGNYCTGCESFKLDKELVNGKCPDHFNLDLVPIEEENWFFRLSKYKDGLKKWIADNPSFLQPISKIDELKNLIEDLDDISVSRLKTSVPWGVEVPNDKEQIVYVWMDALLNYIFSCGYPDKMEEFNEWWDDTIQICGSDNLRFQAVIFQALLASAGIKQTGKLLVHGTILDKDGKKMSKTMNNVVDPVEQVKKYGLTAVRYYILAGLSTYSNSSWSEEDLVKLYNSHLADDFGNLVARVLHLVDVKNVVIDESKVEPTFKSDIQSCIDLIQGDWERYEIKMALEATNAVVKSANKYITDEAPWNKDSQNYEVVLNNLFWFLRVITELYKPVIPEKIAEISAALVNKKKSIIFAKI